MHNSSLRIGLMSLAVTAGLAAFAGAADEKHAAGKKEEGEVKMALGDVPSSVRKTFAREAPGAKIKVVDKEMAGGKLVYEADVEIDGDNYEIIVDGKGKLLSKKLDLEEEEKPAAKKAGGEEKAKGDKSDKEDGEKPRKAKPEAKGDKGEKDDGDTEKADKPRKVKPAEKGDKAEKDKGDVEDGDKPRKAKPAAKGETVDKSEKAEKGERKGGEDDDEKGAKKSKKSRDDDDK